MFGQLFAVAVAVPENILNNPRHLGLPDDVVPWMLVAHYREHAQAVKDWLHRTNRPIRETPEQ